MERSGREERKKQAYVRFVNYMNKQSYQKAFRVFDRAPGLVDYMRLGEVPVFYRSLRANVGAEEARLFRVAFRGTLDEMAP